MSFAIVSLRFQPIHIQAVALTTYFASTQTRRQTPHRRSVKAAAGKPVTVLSSRAGHVTPSQLRGLYKTFTYVPTAADRNTLGVFGFRKDYLTTFTVELVNGGRYEPNIDVQYASAMAYPTPIIFYSIGGSEKWSMDGGKPLPGDADLESLDYLLKKTNNPPWRSYVEVLVVFGFRKDYPSKTDLTMFMTYFRSDVQPPSLATFTVELVNGGRYEPNNPTIEANIDVQYTSAMAYPTPIIFYSIGGLEKWLTDGGEPLPRDADLESLDYLLKKTDNPPWRSYIEVLVVHLPVPCHAHELTT
ncbi:hypothetical protein EDB85DRAFT_2296732 [Lactarius pseudohatsudake]|nr:hypothetical protein EDB85DRAFT_2296732 [Lactarius pseudohatsudake]